MKIVAQLVVGPGEGRRYLREVLFNLKSRGLCDDILICLNNTDIYTERLVKKFTSHIYYDNREWGKLQPYIKEDFVRKYVAQFKPDWVIALDADEVFEKQVTREVLEELASKPYDVAYFFWCIEFWDKLNQYRSDYCFEDTRFYKFIPDKLGYRKQPVHCGMIPEFLHRWATRSNYLFYHYGLMNKKDRARKFERYKKYDPKNIYLPKYWYEGLLQEGVATPWNRDLFLKKAKPTLFRKKPVPFTQQSQVKKVYKFINPHGQLIIFDQERHYRQALSRRGFKFLGYEDVIPMTREEQPVVENSPILPTQSEDLKKSIQEIEDSICDDCGFVAKSIKALRIHRGRKHKSV